MRALGFLSFAALAIFALMTLRPEAAQAQYDSASAEQAAPYEPPGNVYDYAPFNSPRVLRGSTGSCGRTFSCADAQYSSYDIVAEANACVRRRFGMQTNIMSHMEGYGPYESCVVPSTFEVNTGTGTPRWAVCCMQTIADTPDQCELRCTSFLTPDKIEAGAE